MPREIWKPIFDGWYEVSSLGRVRRAKPGVGTYVGRICKQHLCPHRGYLFVGLSVLGESIRCDVHTLVAKAFLGPYPKGKEPNHKNLIKTDNRKSNLEYLTRQKNIEKSEIHSELNNQRRSRTMKKLRAQQRRDGTLRTMCTSKRYR